MTPAAALGWCSTLPLLSKGVQIPEYLVQWLPVRAQRTHINRLQIVCRLILPEKGQDFPPWLLAFHLARIVHEDLPVNQALSVLMADYLSENPQPELSSHQVTEDNHLILTFNLELTGANQDQSI